MAFGGIYLLRRLPQGVLNGRTYFQGAISDVLDGPIERVCLALVDDIELWGQTMEQPISALDVLLVRLEKHDLLVVVHKAVFYHEDIRWHRTSWPYVGIGGDAADQR